MKKKRFIIVTFLSFAFFLNAQAQDMEILQSIASKTSSVDPMSNPTVEETIKDDTERTGQENVNKLSFEDKNYSYAGTDSYITAPIDPYDQDSLSHFGYDFFTDTPSTYVALTNIPIPPDYVLGPTDTIKILLYGNKNDIYNLKVSREGEILFPGIGPITAAGLKFQDLKETISLIVSNQFIGTSVKVTFGPLRSINVFVLGEAIKPGMYTVSGTFFINQCYF